MDILIAGAGIGGVTFAGALAALDPDGGHRVTFVERDADPAGPQFGLMLTPNAIVALGRVGLDRAVVDAGVALGHLAVLGPDGARLHAEDLRDRPVPTVGITRRELLAVLAPHLAPHLRASIVRPAQVAHVEPALHAGGDGPVSVRLDDGSVHRADLVIGADGPFSTVRPFLDPAEPQYRGYLTWRALVARPGAMPSDGVLCDAGGLQFGAYPVDADTLHVFVYAHESTFAVLAPAEHLRRLRRLAGQFEPALGPLALAAAAATNVVHTPVFEVETSSPVAHGRLALLGDAAHTFVPVGSQGAAMAIEDAVSLAISLMSNPGDVAAALDRYRAVRTPRWQDVRVVTRYRSALSALEGPEAFAAGPALLPLLPDPARLRAENLDPPL